MKAMDVNGLGIYRLRIEPDGYELECTRCLHKVDLDEKGDAHATWTAKGGHVSLARTCPNPL